jgi:prolyl-tRNA synthetase
MTHSDDDGLVLPPRMAPKHVVILPIYRGDEDRSKVRAYCDRVQKELQARDFAGEKIRVQIDDRDLRGGEKSWQQVKRGVPLRVEIGPRDLEKDSVFLARRDTGAKEPIGHEQFVQTAAEILTDIQNTLFQRALRLRAENTRPIDNVDDFKAYFTSKDADKPEIHGGFAMCHWAEDPAVDELLKELKVTIRCLPLDAAEESGRCIFTGKPSRRRAVFAKAY